MKLQIDFYSKDEMSVQANVSDKYIFVDDEDSELLLFACYTLRQFWNYGRGIVSNTLAGLLVSREDVDELFSKKPTLQNSDHLLNNFANRAIELKLQTTETDNTQERIQYYTKLRKELDYDKFIVQALDAEILSTLPNLVEYRGQGKKSFNYTLPPSSLIQKGFGILGFQVNYFGFHSIIGVLRFLSRKRNYNQEYINRLATTASFCANMHIMNLISVNQNQVVVLGTEIVKHTYAGK